ncbi:MAG TPA: ADOP family duplicated permease [Vicinamibacterales bacterium]|jgi:predicted permease|nr:ADOP family duplicated permease [Vicinamibacterales bacterium]
MTTLFRRLTHLIQRRRAEQDLADEMAFHREMLEEEFRSHGGESSRHAARRAMGSAMLAAEDARAVWISTHLESVWQDVRLGARSLRRSPGLVIVSALSLGLGIGLNTILYLGVTAIYRHHPTMVDARRVVGVEPGNSNQFSYPNLRDLRSAGIFEDATGFRHVALNWGRGADGAIPIRALGVGSNFFDVLGAKAEIGRLFSDEDAAELEPRTVIVTRTFWQTSLSGDPDVLGKTMTLAGQPFTIVGVLPAAYRSITGWVGPQVYVPLSKLVLPTIGDRGSPAVTVVARLAADSETTQGNGARTAGDAQTAVTALGASLERLDPQRNADMSLSASVFPADELQFRGTPPGFLFAGALLWGSVVAVLVIACINVMGLLTARATERRHEIAIRVAIGAGRARVAQAMLIESLLLVLTGTAVSIGLTYVFSQIPIFDALVMIRESMSFFDPTVILYGAVLIGVATVACGLLPALRATKGDCIASIQGGHGSTPRQWLRNALVAGQVAMSLVLVVFAILCVRSQMYVNTVNPGFDLDHGLVVRLSLGADQYVGADRVRLAQQLVDEATRLPGVETASVANMVPLGGDSIVRSFHPAGLTDVRGARPWTYSVGPRFFKTLQIPLASGREFLDSDDAGAQRVAIVNETYVRTHLAPGEKPLGRRVQTADEPSAQIVGVVRDSRIDTIGEAPRPVVYYSFAQRPRDIVVHVRASGAPDRLVSPLWRAVGRFDTDVPVSVATLRRAAGTELTMRKTATWLAGSIGGLGVLLAMVGLYGVMAYAVASRREEIGIRMALGASSRQISRDVLAGALTIVCAGIFIGSAAAAGIAPALETFLVGVRPFDPLSLAFSALLLLLVGAAATLIPARRASRVDPMDAFRAR